MKITFNKKIRLIDKGASYQEIFDAAREIKAIKLTEGRKEMSFRTEFPPKANLVFKGPAR